ncbi:hypothetical protein PU13_24045 [Escherichia coli]|nr:hypothetical protein PU13_24045 [Escherichia coli]
MIDSNAKLRSIQMPFCTMYFMMESKSSCGKEYIWQEKMITISFSITESTQYPKLSAGRVLK